MQNNHPAAMVILSSVHFVATVTSSLDHRLLDGEEGQSPQMRDQRVTRMLKAFEFRPPRAFALAAIRRGLLHVQAAIMIAARNHALSLVGHAGRGGGRGLSFGL